MSLAAVGLCLPQSCTARELQGVWAAIFQALNASDQFLFSSSCGNQHVNWDGSGAMIMIIICFLLGLIVTAATLVSMWELSQSKEVPLQAQSTSIHDYQSVNNLKGDERLPAKLLRCFSLMHNLEKFGQIRSGTPTSCLDGIRTLSMCWVVLGHTLLWPFDANLPGYSNIGSIVPFFSNDSLIASWTGQVILSAEFSVDSFFFMSGFLATYIGIKKLGKSGMTVFTPLKAAPFMYLDRFLRLTPTYMFIVLTYTHVVPLLSSGPFWTLLDQVTGNWLYTCAHL